MTDYLPYNLDDCHINFRKVTTNGVQLNVAEAGDGPIIFLLHGFPEGWASWGPQIHFLTAQGYKVVVPEMRGYGESDAPEAVEAYDTVELAADIAGLIDAYSDEMNDSQGVIIGHDWGCSVAWHTAWLHPEKVKAVGGLSVPWFGRGEVDFLTTLEHSFPENYFYILDFQRDELDSQLNVDLTRSLTLCLLGEADLFNQPNDGTSFLDRIQLPENHPTYMPQSFLDYTISRYKNNGFRPPLNWYRNFKRTFQRTEGMSDIIKPPAMFLTGTDEWTHEYLLASGHDLNNVFADLRINASTQAGHWLGQEKPTWVNEHIKEFLLNIGH